MNFVAGIQGDDPFWLQACSTCKHYASYNMDNWHGMDRYHYDAVVTPQDWAECVRVASIPVLRMSPMIFLRARCPYVLACGVRSTYSQPFQACVVGANASGIMCS